MPPLPDRLFNPVAAVYRRFGRVVPCDVARVYRLETGGVRAPRADASGFEFRFLSADEMQRFSGVAETAMTADAAELVADGAATCFAALKDGELAAYACFGMGEVEAEHNRGGGRLAGIGLQLDEQARFLFKAFAVPRFRGHALMSWVIFHACQVLQTLGVREIVTTTDWTNRAFQISAERCGFRLCGHTAEMKLFGRHFYRYPDLDEAPFRFVGGLVEQGST